jgi:hypothetical protein
VAKTQTPEAPIDRRDFDPFAPHPAGTRATQFGAERTRATQFKEATVADPYTFNAARWADAGATPERIAELESGFTGLPEAERAAMNEWMAGRSNAELAAFLAGPDADHEDDGPTRATQFTTGPNDAEDRTGTEQ